MVSLLSVEIFFAVVVEEIMSLHLCIHPGGLGATGGLRRAFPEWLTDHDQEWKVPTWPFQGQDLPPATPA